ncbi:SpoIID/LytB domain-containing protein [Pectinatus sottacetonis]|uniref:SpoIID/LytB domain-containing protein n=1 Tax=Pectinatus sottacetonis TaxID=1002795 RepID=UPI0018C80F5E|nr:SpoIID/LytB domain-containing protein [Pectinatus sottacetonis]
MDYRKYVVMVVAFVITAASSLTVSAAEPNIRVGIWINQSSVLVSNNAVFTIKDPGTNDVYGKFDAGDKVLITQKNNRLYINKLPVKSMVISISSVEKESRTQVNGKTYRGIILIKRAVKGMTVINYLPLEQYLYSVVPQEMPSSWPMAALKAQAVAARTYALYSMHRHENEGFDVCAMIHCQIYGGSGVENEIAKQAVDETRGKVIFYEHKPIFAAFHASSGGKTESSRDIWGTPVPYLKSVTDYDQKSPDYHWQIKMTPENLSEKLARNGYDIGKIKSVTLSAFGSGSEDRSPAGAVKTVIFTGDKDTVKLTGREVRHLLGLKSSKFAISVIVQSPKKLKVTIDKYSGYGKDIAVALPDYQVPNSITGPKSIHRITGHGGELVLIDGYGAGHRVGMSQWGAKALADKGYDYQKIIYTYYTDVSIGNMYK